MRFPRKTLMLSLISLLVYVCWTLLRIYVINEKLRDDLKIIQKTLVYQKPSTSWDYNNTWRSIGKPTRGQLIYSAYFDARIEVVRSVPLDHVQMVVGSVRIFAVLPMKFKDIISCIIRYDDFSLKEVLAEDQTCMHEDHDRQFSAYTIMCPLRVSRNNTTLHLPQAVAITYASNPLSQMSPTFVPISYPRKMESILAKSRPVLSVCVGPLQFAYSNVLRVVEFVEMYRILGATHFYFYNLNTSEEVLRVLRHYQQQGLADVLDWKLHYWENELHYGGITAQFNECIFRAMVVDNYRYAAVVDLDEVLMPLKHNSLMDYLRQCDEGRTSAFVFRNVFFHKRDSNDTFSMPAQTRNRHLYTQTKLRRTVEVQPIYTRSKYIVNTRGILELCNHRTWRDMPGYSDNVLHPSVGLLFHYRDKCINCKATLMVDFTARRFGSLIWENVDDTCLQVFTENGGYCPAS